jgi:hypothetical protein
VLILERLQDAWRALARPWPLRAYLFAFGWSLILPGLLFAALGIVGFGSSDRTAQNRAALEIARAARNELDRHVDFTEVDVERIFDARQDVEVRRIHVSTVGDRPRRNGARTGFAPSNLAQRRAGGSPIR